MADAPVRLKQWFVLPVIGLLIAAWLGCYVPWTSWGSGAAFSSNVYDLAEWMSLTPAVRAGNPPLLPVFLLRIVPGLIAVALSINVAGLASNTLRWSLRGLALLIAIGLLPPFDFFRNGFGDPNYRQQAMLATIVSLAVLASWWRPVRRLVLPVAALALLAGVAGLLMSLHELEAFRLRVAPGPGAVLTLAVLALIAMLNLPRIDSRVRPQKVS